MISKTEYALLVCCYRRGFKFAKAHEWVNDRGYKVSLDFIKEQLPKVIDRELRK